MKIRFGIAWMAVILLTTACQTEHKVAVEPVEVKPIHITIDVNVRVDRALDDFFNEIDAASQKEDAGAPAPE